MLFSIAIWYKSAHEAFILAYTWKGSDTFHPQELSIATADDDARCM
jgi:hypothetical protein